jgi:hypothetical protein
MIQVHDTFVCKPGNAGKLARMMKEHMPFDPQKGPYVLTDVTGQYHRVIMIMNYENLAAWEADYKKMTEDTEENRKMAETFKDMNSMYHEGKREFFKVW